MSIVSRPIEHGTPGGFATRLAWRARLRAGAALAVVALSIWGLYAFLPESANLQVLAPAAAVIIAASALARHWLSAAQAAAVGARSERRVASSLRKFNPTALLHSVDLRAGGDADHLVLGPKLVVVETKTGAGHVVYKDGKIFVNNRPLRGDPVAQCRRQARAARDGLGAFCDAIVCVVDMKNDWFVHNTVLVCSLRDLHTALHSLPDRLSDVAARSAAAKLAPRTSTLHDKLTTSPRRLVRAPEAQPRSDSRSDSRPDSRSAPHSSSRDKTLHRGNFQQENLGDTHPPRKFRPRRTQD